MALVASAMQIAFWSIVIPTAIYVLIKLIGDFFYAIGTMLFRVMDMLQSVFRKLAGLGTVYVEGEAVEGDILTYIMKSNVVVDVLVAVAVFGLGLVILGSIVQMVRLEYTTEGSKNSKDKIFTTALKSLIMFILIPIVCFVGIRLSNYMLQAVDYATSASGASTVSGSVFQSSVADASKVYTRDNWGNGADIGALLTSLLAGKDFNNAVAVIENGSTAKVMHFDDISISSSEQGSEMNLGGLFGKAKVPESKGRTCEKLAKKVGELFVLATVDDEGIITVGYTPTGSEWHIQTRLEADNKLSYLDVESVSYFYNTGNINYLILYLGAYICIKALFEAAMGMIARIYKVVALFVIAPAAIGLQPIDDGNAYKSWKKSFIQNVLSAYGFIVALNLYFMVVGVLQTIELWNGWGSWLPNKFIQFLFVLTGATMIKDLSSMFAGLIGAADAMADGAKASSEVGKIAGSVAKVGMGAAQLGGAAFKGMGAAVAKWSPTLKREAVIGKDGNVVKNKDGSDKTRITGIGSSLGWQQTKEAVGNIAGKTVGALGYKKNDAGEYVNKKGDKLKSDGILSKGMKVGEDARTRMTTDKSMAKQSAKVVKRSLDAGQSLNRFGDFVQNSGLAKTFNNLTGGIGGYLSGKAYKGVDEQYQKDLQDAGIDTELYGMPKAGTSFVSRAAGGITNTLYKSQAGIAKYEGKSSQMYATNETNKQQAEMIANETKQGIKNENKELGDKKKSIYKEQAAMKKSYSDIDNDSGYDDQAANIKRTQEFLDKIKKYLGGTMTKAALAKEMSSFKSSSAYTGNSEAKEIAKEITSILNNRTMSNAEKREVLSKNANVNIDNAELGHRMRDAANKQSDGSFGTYGSSKERQAYRDGNDAMSAIQEKIKENAATYAKVDKKHKDLTQPGKVVNIDGENGYAKEMSKEVGDAMKRANEELARKLKNEGIKAHFGEDLKFKIDDAPITSALTKIQEKLAQMERDRKAKESGDTNKLLKQLIEETKKKK